MIYTILLLVVVLQAVCNEMPCASVRSHMEEVHTRVLRAWLFQAGVGLRYIFACLILQLLYQHPMIQEDEAGQRFRIVLIGDDYGTLGACRVNGLVGVANTAGVELALCTSGQDFARTVRENFGASAGLLGSGSSWCGSSNPPKAVLEKQEATGCRWLQALGYMLLCWLIAVARQPAHGHGHASPAPAMQSYAQDFFRHHAIPRGYRSRTPCCEPYLSIPGSSPLTTLRLARSLVSGGHAALSTLHSQSSPFSDSAPLSRRSLASVKQFLCQAVLRIEQH